MPERTEITIEPTSGSSVALDFGKISYTEKDIGKTYVYTVTESGEIAGVTNSAAKTATVTVTDKGDGTLTVINSLNTEAMVLVNTYEAVGDTTLTATKTIVNRNFQEGDSWMFMVTATEGAPMPEKTEITIEPTSGSSAALDFGKISYTEEDIGKTYVYTVTESGEIAGVTNSAARTATVTIADNGDGTLAVSNSLDTEPMVLVNTYGAEGEITLTATKAIENRAFQAGDRWTFTVTAADGVPMPEQTTITITPTAGTRAAVNFGTIRYTEADIGNTYTYTITETGRVANVENDTPKTVNITVTDNGDGTLNVTRAGNEDPRFVNVYIEPERETVTVQGRKTWIDQDNARGLRPVQILIILYADEVETDRKYVSEKEDWSWTFTNLDKFDEDGNEISYTITEGEVPGYVSLQEGYDLTNVLEPSRTTQEIVKVWDDMNNLDETRPESIPVTLLANGNEVQTVTLNQANNWSAEVQNLPEEDDNGQKIEYVWQEPEVAGYTATTQKVGNLTILTNYHAPELTSVSIRKVWADNDDELGLRPGSVTVELSTGQKVRLSAANGWRATVNNLPVTKGGAPVSYTWKEQSVGGYVLSDTAAAGRETVITNSVWTRPDPEIPEDEEPPKLPGRGTVIIEDNETPLGIELLMNSVGDCFE